LVIALRSKRLAHLFAKVWNQIPKRDRDSIARRAPLIVDNHLFLPKNHRPVWGSVICVRLRRSISILYLSPRKLPSQADAFVCYVIAHELAHVRKGHAEQLFRLTANESTVAKFEREANEQGRRWGFPRVSPK
jgi:predicted metal-dependent hydrolase